MIDMKKNNRLISALLCGTILFSAAFSTLIPASAAEHTPEEIEQYISSIKGFSSDDLEKYKEYYDSYSKNPGYNVPSADRLKSAIDILESGIDYYDDFENFGEYQATDYPSATGEKIKTSVNTTNYDILWSGIKNEDGIKRKPYSSTTTISSTDKTLFGAKDGKLNFTNFDFDSQYFSGYSIPLQYWYVNNPNEAFPTRAWTDGAFVRNFKNQKFNILTLKKNILASKPIQSATVTVSAYDGNKVFLIYNYTDFNNWAAVGLGTNSQSGVIMFRCVEGKLVKNDGTTYANENSYITGRNWNEYTKISNVIDAANAGDKSLKYIIEYDNEKGNYNFKISGGNTTSRTWELLSGDRTDNLRIITMPTTKNLYTSFESVEISLLSARKIINLIDKLPEIDALTLADKETVEKVNTEYEALPDELKEDVYNYSKLVAALARVKKLQEDYDNSLTLNDKILSFEDGSGKEFFEKNDFMKITDNPAKDEVNSSNKVLTVEKNSGTIALKEKFKGTAAIITGKTYLKFYGGNLSICPTYIDKDNYTSISIGATKTNRIALGFSGKINGKNYTPSDYGQDLMSGINWAGSGWIDFRIAIDGTTATINLAAMGTDGKYYYNTCEWKVRLCAASDFLIAFSGSSNAACYIDDLAIAYNDVDEYYNAQYFLESNSYILGLYPFEQFISNKDEEEYTKLISEYNLLSELEKAYIGEDTCQKVADLQNLFSDAASLPDDTERYNDAQNYHRINDSADKYTKAFRAFTNGDNDDSVSVFYAASRRDGMVEIVNDETLGRNVLRLGSNVKISLKDKFVSEKTILKEVSYKIRATEEIKSLSGWQANHPKLTINVLESGNKSYYINLNAKSYSAVGTTTTSAVYEPDEQDRVFNVNTDISVKIVYSSNSATATLTDANGAMEVITVKLPTGTRNRLTFSTNANDGIREYHKISFATEIWNIQAYFTAGDWDDDVTQTDIKVAYTGNTYQAPGDIVMVRGENLGKVVKSAKLIRLDDSMTGFGFIDRTSYDYDGVHTGEFNYAPVNSTYSADSDVWNDELKAINLSLIHKETDSLKFIIPKTDASGAEMKHGIYAVLLRGNYGTQKRTKVIYINSPWIDYTIGSDGGLCSPGTEVDIIGENIAPNQQLSGEAKADYKRVAEKTASELRVRMWKSGDRSRYWDLEIADVKSTYALSVMIPKNITVPADGSTVTYELSVYNGYGDNTAWSIPYKIKLGKSIQSQIPDNIINIKDEGATGVATQNATAIIQNALTKLYNMGGGTLYLPAGIYRTEYTIYIPENVNIIGEGRELASLMPTYLGFGLGQAPAYAYQLSGNNKLSHFTVYFMRGLRVFQGKGTTENVELSDIRFYGNPTAWSNNSYGATKPIGGSDVLPFLMAKEANQNNNGIISGRFKNLKVIDFICEVNRGDLCMINSYDSAAEYYHFDNVYHDSNDTWNRSVASHSIYENCNLSGNNATQARGVYHHNVTFRKAIGYNRELWVADLAPESGVYWQYMPIDENGNIDENGSTENSVYIKVESTRDINKCDYYATQQRQIYVISGNGVGQTREIVGVDKENGCLIIDRPFDVAINRNSRLTVRIPREDIYFYNVNFHEGFAGGFYGGCADVVYDGTYHTRHCAMYQQAIFGDVNWYMSTINDVWEYMPYNIAAVFGVNKMSTYFWKSSVEKNYLQVGILMRNNDVSGAPATMDCYNDNETQDFIFDNNRFNEMPYILEFLKNGTPNGLIFYRNTGNKLKNLIKGGNPNGINSLGNTYCLMLENGEGSLALGREYGDVNNDGEVTLKDVSAIRYYLVGEYDLDDNDKLYTDVNNDGVIDLQDALYIQYFVSGEITSLPVTDD